MIDATKDRTDITVCVLGGGPGEPWDGGYQTQRGDGGPWSARRSARYGQPLARRQSRIR